MDVEVHVMLKTSKFEIHSNMSNKVMQKQASKFLEARNYDEDEEIETEDDSIKYVICRDKFSLQKIDGENK